MRTRARACEHARTCSTGCVCCILVGGLSATTCWPETKLAKDVYTGVGGVGLPCQLLECISFTMERLVSRFRGQEIGPSAPIFSQVAVHHTCLGECARDNYAACPLVVPSFILATFV